MTQDCIPQLDTLLAQHEKSLIESAKDSQNKVVDEVQNARQLLMARMDVLDQLMKEEINELERVTQEYFEVQYDIKELMGSLMDKTGSVYQTAEQKYASYLHKIADDVNVVMEKAQHV